MKIQFCRHLVASHHFSVLVLSLHLVEGVVESARELLAAAVLLQEVKPTNGEREEPWGVGLGFLFVHLKVLFLLVSSM